MSTHAGLLAALAPCDVDESALADLALMGWLVGDHTPWRQVAVLPPGATATLRDGECDVVPAPETTPREGRAQPRGAAVEEAARRLRVVVGGVLDRYPDAVLQLTGGLDSRVLLGAVEPDRRPGLRALTLAVPGSQDPEIAAEVARRTGLRHEVVAISSVELDDAGWAEEVVGSAVRLSGSADPVARAAVEVVEATLGPQVRVAGLGGEVTRGFYYGVLTRNSTVTPARAARLARWRLFPNGSVPAFVLGAERSEALTDAVTGRVHGILRDTGLPWLDATDEFYLWQRMRRWAGALAGAQPADRPTVNPMLDRGFLDVARALPPSAKHGMAFLAGLMVELDPALADLPLDGRPPPRAYVSPSRRTTSLVGVSATKATRKAVQRARGSRRRPAGADQATAAVQQQLRQAPDRFRAAADLGLVSSAWYESVTRGEVALDPASAAFLVNVEVVAALASGRAPGGQLMTVPSV